MNALEILKKTPKTNCGKCGYPACMAFAVAVVSSGENLAKCPHIEAEDNGAQVEQVRDPDTVLLKTLKNKVGTIDLAERAQMLGGRMVKEQGSTMLELSYLGEQILISEKAIITASGTEPDPRDQILLYNYLFFGGKGDLSEKWVGLESFPNSISKVVTLKRYTEDKLAREFEGKRHDLERQLLAMKAQKAPECHADLCMVVPVLPKVPVLVNFWDADEEDGFAASVKVLFDENALKFLDIESLIFAAERLAEKACGQ